jgi:hypothetical protein
LECIATKRVPVLLLVLLLVLVLALDVPGKLGRFAGVRGIGLGIGTKDALIGANIVKEIATEIVGALSFQILEIETGLGQDG